MLHLHTWKDYWVTDISSHCGDKRIYIQSSWIHLPSQTWRAKNYTLVDSQIQANTMSQDSTPYAIVSVGYNGFVGACRLFSRWLLYILIYLLIQLSTHITQLVKLKLCQSIFSVQQRKNKMNFEKCANNYRFSIKIGNILLHLNRIKLACREF